MKARSGVLLVNLGSPASPQLSHVRHYLREFLMDPMVIDLPWILRWLLVHTVILPFRPKRTARAYSKIWTEEGSPLVAISRQLAEILSKEVKPPVEMAFRYGEPGIKQGVSRLMGRGVGTIYALP